MQQKYQVRRKHDVSSWSLVVVESCAMQKKGCAVGADYGTPGRVIGAMKSLGTVIFSCDTSAPVQMIDPFNVFEVGSMTDGALAVIFRKSPDIC